MKKSAQTSGDQSLRIRAVLSKSASSDAPTQEAVMPWERDGEFEIDALVVTQEQGKIVVRITQAGKQVYLNVKGFLPGHVKNQCWRLFCVRESGTIELLDGQRL